MVKPQKKRNQNRIGAARGLRSVATHDRSRLACPNVSRRPELFLMIFDGLGLEFGAQPEAFQRRVSGY